MTSLRDHAEAVHRFGLQRARSAFRLAVAGRDRTAPVMAETRELIIDTPAGSLAARFYRPVGASQGGPALIFFHGGGFVVSDLETHDALCRRLADAGRMTVIASEYRLAPEAPFPAQLEDGFAATQWILRRATSLGFDLAKLSLGGDSAGAYIAATVAQRMNRERRGTIAGQVLIYPLLQLEDEVWGTVLLTEARVVGRIAVRYIRAQLKLFDTPAPSLLVPDRSVAPRTLIVSGGPLDPCRSDARLYGGRLAAAGVEVVSREYPALPHGFASLTHASAKAREAVRETGAAMGELLRR